MGAIGLKTAADLRRRRLQSVVIAAVLFLAGAAATLALGILVESRAPFEAAFARANGAHLAIEYAPTVDAAALAATGSVPGVTASGGPWPIMTGAIAHPKGGFVGNQAFSGRPQPDASIDAVTIEAGRWWQATGEVVLDQDSARLLGLGVGDTVELHAAPTGTQKAAPVPGGSPPGFGPAHALTVVGIAASVSTPDVAAWLSPTDLEAIDSGNAPHLQMLYRVDPSASAADVGAALARITAGLPPTAVAGTTTYLDVKAGVDQLADLYVPVLLAFSIFALLAAAFTIANVVGGIVLTSYREIGVMKAVGYTPSQVTATLVGQILVPVVAGLGAGVAAGTFASQPIIRQTSMSFGLPADFAVSWPVIAAVLAVGVLMAVVAAIGPAMRAGRLSPATALTRGAAPSRRSDGGRLRRAGLRLPAALPIRLGIATGVAQPLRAAMTLGALVVGVAAVTFALGLNASLLRVMEDLNRNTASPVRAQLFGDGVRPEDVTSAIVGAPGTGSFVSIGEAQVSVPRLGAVPFFGYRNDASWLGFEVIRGRWSTSPGEVVASTNVFARGGFAIGDAITMTGPGGTATVRLVGEIFDATDRDHDNLVLRGSWTDAAAVEPGIGPSRWEVAPAAGVDVRGYHTALQQALGPGVDVWVEGDSSSDDSFMLFLGVVAILGAVLVAISLGGVFNTVLLETRQRTHELAVLKAIGLTPVQVVSMVVAAVVPIAVLAGLVGVPIGLVAQRVVLTYMGQVAASTDIPASVFEVFPPAMLVALALSGLAIGVAGALLPAQRAARIPIAPVLQAE
jgi:putative ABC transport system permease protein